jgi:hypothetical protein
VLFRSVARSDAILVMGHLVRSAADIDGAIADLAMPGGGLIVPPDAYTLVHRAIIVNSARRHGVPAIYSYRQIVREGGLLSYGPETADIFRRSASYVDRILRGAKPGQPSMPDTSQIRVGRQSSDGDGAWPRRSIDPHRARRRGDRITAASEDWGPWRMRTRCWGWKESDGDRTSELPAH